MNTYLTTMLLINSRRIFLLEFLQVVGWRGYCHRSVNQLRMLLPSTESDYSLDPPCSAMPSAPMPTGGIQVRLLT